MKRSHDHSQKFTQFWWSDRGLSAILLVLVTILFLSPFVTSPLVAISYEVFFALLLISGVSVISTRRVVRYTAITIAVVTMGVRVLLNFQSVPSPPLVILALTLSLLAMGTLTLVIMIQAFRPGEAVTSHRIRGAIAAYLLVGVTWTIIYQLLYVCLPAAFSLPGAGTSTNDYQDSFTYFSFVTLTTLGYGDITAIHPLARLFAISEALIGQLYPATLLARLVSLELLSHQNTAGGKR